MSKGKRSLRGGLAAGAASAAGLAYLVAAFGSFRGLALAVDHAPRAFVDFVYVYYPAGRAVLDSGEVVQGFFYSPFFALAVAPLTALPGSAPLFAWIGLQLAVAIALGVAGPLLVPERPPALTTAYALVFPLSFPVVHGFSWGQVSGLLVALALYGLWLVERRRPALGGALLGLAAAIKYYPIVLALPWLLGRAWRALVALALVLVVALALLPAAFLGIDGTLAFYGEVRAMIDANEALLAEDVNSQYFPHVLGRWAGASQGDAPSPPPFAKALSWVCLALVVAIALLVPRSRVTRPSSWSFILLLLATPFWVPTSWPHYFVYLPFVQLFLGSEAWRATTRSPGLKGTLLALVLASALVSSVPFFQIVGGKAVYGGSGALFVANALLLAGTVAWLAPRLKKAGGVEA